jgi:hypothetical protein
MRDKAGVEQFSTALTIARFRFEGINVKPAVKLKRKMEGQRKFMSSPKIAEENWVMDSPITHKVYSCWDF